MDRRTKTTIMTWAAIITGFGAAAFWLWSASISIPGVALTFDADFSPLTNTLNRQSHISGIAAGLTGVSVIFQACAQYLAKEA